MNPSWKPPFIYRPNHLLQVDETSNWILTISQFLVQGKRKGCIFFYVYEQNLKDKIIHYSLLSLLSHDNDRGSAFKYFLTNIRR